MTTKMEKPTVEAVRFQSTDVIATSGALGVMLGGFNDETKGNWFVSGTKGATEGEQATNTVLGYFKTASGVDVGDFKNWKFQNGSGNPERFDFLMEMDRDGDAATYDGWYTWFSNGSNSYFKRQSLN